MCLFLYSAGRNDFDAGKSISRAIGRGLALKSRLWALKWQQAKRVPFGQKIWDFQGSILPMELGMNFPPSKSLNPNVIWKREKGRESWQRPSIRASTLWLTLPLRTEKSDENPSAARYGTCFKYVLRNNVAHAAWLVLPVLRIRIRDPGLGAFWPRDPE